MHCRTSTYLVPWCLFPASTFLHHFPSPSLLLRFLGFLSRYLHISPFCGTPLPVNSFSTIGALTPALRSQHRQVSPLTYAITSCRSILNHVACLYIALTTTSACKVFSRLRHYLAGSPSPPRRNRFLNVKTDISLPVTPHPVSRQRSYLQLQSCGLLWNGLAPFCYCALTGVQGALRAIFLMNNKKSLLFVLKRS